MGLNPARHYQVFAGLVQQAQAQLTSGFLKWAFRGPTVTRGAPALQQGQWYPIETEKDAAGTESPLGEGGQGVVHLWCCIDANNRIIDRVIVKNIFPGTEAWVMPSMWRGQQIGGEPREAWICNLVYDALEAENPGDGRFVTRCLGYGDLKDPLAYDEAGGIDTYPVPNPGFAAQAGKPVTHQIASYKLYFEYCPHGDLHDQIREQRKEEEGTVMKVKGPGTFP